MRLWEIKLSEVDCLLRHIIELPKGPISSPQLSRCQNWWDVIDHIKCAYECVVCVNGWLGPIWSVQVIHFLISSLCKVEVEEEDKWKDERLRTLQLWNIYSPCPHFESFTVKFYLGKTCPSKLCHKVVSHEKSFLFIIICMCMYIN